MVIHIVMEKTRIDNKKIRTHKFSWKTPDGKSHGQKRRIIHYIKNWYKKGEYKSLKTYTPSHIYIYGREK